MTKPKALCLIRISTEAQEIEEQRKQTLQMAYDDGYKPEEVVVVGGVGSAIKCDDAYMKNLNDTYQLLEANKSIECVYAWEVSRIGRRESLLHQFREYLVNHKIQLKIRVGGLVLLDADGNESFGVKIAFSLFAAMAVAEMETKKARFKRSKDRNTQLGRCNGNAILYGYTVNEDGFYIVDKDQAPVIRMIYKMYASGKYSIASMCEELISQGYTANGKKLNPVTIGGWLRQGDAYLGIGKVKYPQILDHDVVDAVRKQLKNAVHNVSRASRRIMYGSKLLRCECGRYLCGTNKSYACSHVIMADRLRIAGEESCPYNMYVSSDIVDGLLWKVCRDIHIMRLGDIGNERIEETKAEIKVIAKKLAVLQGKVAEFETKKKRLTSAYVLGDFDDKEYEAVKNKLMEKHAGLLEEQMCLMDRYTALMEYLEPDSVKGPEADPETVTNEIEARNDRKEMNMLIRKYITGGRVIRTTHDGFKAYRIEIESVIGNRCFIFMPFRRKGNNVIEE